MGIYDIFLHFFPLTTLFPLITKDVYFGHAKAYHVFSFPVFIPTNINIWFIFVGENPYTPFVLHSEKAHRVVVRTAWPPRNIFYGHFWQRVLRQINDRTRTQALIPLSLPPSEKGGSERGIEHSRRRVGVSISGEGRKPLISFAARHAPDRVAGKSENKQSASRPPKPAKVISPSHWLFFLTLLCFVTATWLLFVQSENS